MAAGFFGKIPATGDFVSRGLPGGFRRAWDRWITRHVVPRQDRAGWPAAGLRFRLSSGGRAAAGVIVPGCDSAGRRFPLSLVLTGSALPGPAGLDPWCDAAAALPLAEFPDPDSLWDALNRIEVAPESGPDRLPDRPALLLWRHAGTAEAADPETPGRALDRLLVSSD